VNRVARALSRNLVAWCLVEQVVNLRPIGNRPPRVGTNLLDRRQGVFEGALADSQSVPVPTDFWRRDAPEDRPSLLSMPDSQIYES
jgi:hypothetical protein